MSNGAAKSIGIIVNVITIGIVTLSLGVWISSISKAQQTLSNRLIVLESNQKKIAESINRKLSGNSSSESRVNKLEQLLATLKSDQVQLKSESESRSEQVSSNLSNELEGLEENLRKGQEALKAELMQLVRDELNKTSAHTSVQMPSESVATSTSNEFDNVIDSIKSLSDKSFLELYAFPSERGRSKGFFITDNGETFYVDRANNAIISAWNSVHKNEFKDFIRDLLAKSYRHRKEDLEKAILAVLPVDVIAELQATNLGANMEVKLHSIDGAPTYNESNCRIKVVVSVGSVMKPITVNLPYRSLPGVVLVPRSTTQQASVNPAAAVNTTPLTDTQIIDAIRKVSNSYSAINEAHLFPKSSEKQGVIYAFSAGSNSQLFIIDSSKDLVLPTSTYAFNNITATSAYSADYKLVLRESIQDAIDNHRDKIHRFFLNKHATTAAELEKQVLSGSIKAEVADVKLEFPRDNQSFPVSVNASVTIQAGNLTRKIDSSISCTELPNMRSISR